MRLLVAIVLLLGGCWIDNDFDRFVDTSRLDLSGALPDTGSPLEGGILQDAGLP